MGENQLIDHRHKCCLDRVVTDVLHGTAALVLDMGVAAPRGIFVCRGRVYPALKGITALTADNPAGKAVAALILFAALDDAFFLAALCDQCVCRLKYLTAYDGFVMIGHRVPVFLAVIDVAVELRIGVGLLKNHIAGVFLVADHAAHCCRRPASSLFGGYAVCIQLVRNGVRAFAGKHLFKNPTYRLGLFRIYDHLLAIPIVAVGRIAEFEGAILESSLYGPFVILGNGCRLPLGHAA